MNKETSEMLKILQRLEDATTSTATKIAEDKFKEPYAAVGTMTENVVSMGRYNIIMEKRNLVSGYKKTFYDITDSKGNLLYKDIGLFETSMAILKNLIDDNESKIKKLVSLDEKYINYLSEAAHHKTRSRKINESVQKDVAIAKQGTCIDKASLIKREIKRLI